MRWIEIDLTSPSAACRELLDMVRERQRELPRLQQDVGLDSPAVARFLQEQGQLLFRAVQAHRPDAFAAEAGGVEWGRHLVVDAADLDLPWSCLHNGLRPLLEQAPLTASPWGVDATGERDRQWMRRRHETLFTDEVLGSSTAADVAGRFRPEHSAEPEVLFVDGRLSGSGRARSAEESLRVESALEQACEGTRLARLDVPTEAPSPAAIVRRGDRYQAFHYADVTHRGPETRTVTPSDLGAWDGDQPGADLEIVGVDPVESILDEVSARAERDLAPAWVPQASAVATAPAWRTEDGPLRPEDLAAHDAAPPLVFSNSYLSLAELGPRFLKAGVSTFVGTQALVGSEDARDFAADVYRALAAGHETAAAVREAALAARDRLGDDHPLWLSYGVTGSGSLALQYL